MIYFLIFAFFAGGLFIISSEALGLPPLATAKGVKTAVKSQQSIRLAFDCGCNADCENCLAVYDDSRL